MSHEVVLKGIAYGANWIELTDDQLNEFIDQADGANDLSEIEMVCEIADESFYEYGLLYDGEPEFILEIDGEEKPLVLEELLAVPLQNVTVCGGAGNYHCLVYEMWESIEFNVEANEFDPSQVELMVSDLELPSGAVRRLVSPYYAGDNFEYGDGTPVKQCVYIVKSDGEILTF